MAISENVPSIEVAIKIMNRDLKEYRDDDLEEEDRTTTRYIEASSGQTFEVRIKVRRDFRFFGNSLAFDIFVDGKWMETPMVEKEDCYHGSRKRILPGVTNTAGKLRRFQFATLSTVSDGHIRKEEIARFKDFGTIRIRVIQVWRVALSRSYADADATEGGTVSEKAAKGQALSHRVRLRAPEQASIPESWDTEECRGCPNPVANFVFKYRSMEALKAERIIPRTPTPGPLEDRDPTTLSVDELRELQKRLKELRSEQDTKVKVKREIAEDEERPRRRKVSRPSTDSTQLELDEDGSFRESSTPTAGVPVKREVIEID